jgi:2-polyprenyl-3-methyl-5-hydroxy-6-metoxy-1,4-benzoquinol methylase
VLDALIRKLPLVRDLIKERDELREALRRTDYLPVPPDHLIVRVSGGAEVDKFLGIGRTICGDIMALINLVDETKTWRSFESILDFGCGCGRVTRFLPLGANVTGVDIDDEAIRWCQQNLSSIAKFKVNDPEPPLEYADETFDLIYCISVFSHLPLEMEWAWLRELERVLKPDGWLFISTLSDADLAAAGQSMPDDAGFYYDQSAPTSGLPDFYRLSFHTRAYIEREWQKEFNLELYYPRGINNHQDVSILKKRSAR